MELIVNYPSKFEGRHTLKDRVLMFEAVMELSSNTPNAQARKSGGVGTGKKKRKLQESNRRNQTQNKIQRGEH